MAESKIKYKGPVVLYTGSSFVASISLSQSISSFKRIKIFVNGVCNEIYTNESTSLYLTIMKATITSAGYLSSIRIMASNNGSTLTIDRNNTMTIPTSGNPSIASNTSDYITRVEGYYY